MVNGKRLKVQRLPRRGIMQVAGVKPREMKTTNVLEPRRGSTLGIELPDDEEWLIYFLSLKENKLTGLQPQQTG